MWILPLFIVFLDDEEDFVANAEDQSFQLEFSGKLSHLINNCKLTFDEIMTETEKLFEQIKLNDHDFYHRKIKNDFALCPDNLAPCHWGQGSLLPNLCVPHQA